MDTDDGAGRRPKGVLVPLAGAATGCETPAARRELALFVYLEVLSGREPNDSLYELRYRQPARSMRQRFYRIDRRRQLAETVLALAARADVYIGCAPRRERFGGKRAIERVWTLWADCDDAESAVRLAGFTPAPALVIRSGSGSNRHAYWPLREPLTPLEAEQANRRLAHALAADLAATDAARILRPPGTANHKHQPAAPVTLDALRLGCVRTADEIVGSLEDPPPHQQRSRTLVDTHDDDALRNIPPIVYVYALTGRSASRDGKVLCPFHEDRTPSLHVYDTPEQGWYCYGCGRGGSIYDLAALVWQIEPRGRRFRELRDRLVNTLEGDIE